MTKALLFDFDGVLVETESARASFIHNLLKTEYDLNLNLGYIRQKIQGKPLKIFLAEENFSKDQIESIWSKFQVQYLENLEKIAKPIETNLAFIKKHQGEYLFGLASNGLYEYTTKMLKALAVHNCFDSVTCRDNVSNPKPSADIYLKLLDDINCKPEESLAIEDSLTGYFAANSAGIRCLIFAPVGSDIKEFDGHKIHGLVNFGEQIINFTDT